MTNKEVLVMFIMLANEVTIEDFLREHETLDLITPHQKLGENLYD